VKRLKKTKEQIVLQLGLQEKILLTQMLDLYPRIPAAYQPLSKSAGQEAANQHLLEEALAERRIENKNRLTSILSDPKKMCPSHPGWRLSLTFSEFEQLLQVLNDIRVGSWLKLGAPELALIPLGKQVSPDFWAMEMAGLFQARLLEVLHEGEGREFC
jgi:hypothetical protein